MYGIFQFFPERLFNKHGLVLIRIMQKFKVTAVVIPILVHGAGHRPIPLTGEDL